MHEFSICDGIVRAVVQEMEKHHVPAGHLLKTRIVVGAMHQVVPDTLKYAYEVLTRDTPAAGSELEIRAVPVRAKCKACGWEGEVRIPLFFCGACSSGEIELIGGKEMYLDNLETKPDD